MSHTYSLDELKFDQSKLKKNKLSNLRNIKVNIYLNRREREIARKNGNRLPLHFIIDELYHDHLIHREEFYKIKSSDEMDHESKENRRLKNHTTVGQTSIGQETITNKELSSRNIHCKDLPEDHCTDDEYIAATKTTDDAFKYSYDHILSSKDRRLKLLRHRTYIVEKWDDRMFVLPVICDHTSFGQENVTNKELSLKNIHYKDLPEDHETDDEHVAATKSTEDVFKDSNNYILSSKDRRLKLLRHGTYIVEKWDDGMLVLPVVQMAKCRTNGQRKTPKDTCEIPNIAIFSKYWTSRQKMDGAPFFEQHENLHQQIQAFDKLLHHAMNKFSAKRMYEMLITSCKIFPDMVDSANRIGNFIPSLGTLRTIYDRLEINKVNKLQTDEEVPLMKYLETFFDDLEYLKDLKRYFDERVYMCLYEYFFDPEVDLDGVSFVPDNKTNHNKEAILTYRSSEELYFGNITEKQQLGHTITDMYFMNKKWDLLYKDDELRSEVFDPDSYHEMVKYPRFLDFEHVLRIVPDIFTKAYKSIEIAKIWWSMAIKVYETLPGLQGKTSYTSRQLNKRTSQLEARIEKLTKEIESEEELLRFTLADLDKLKLRDARCEKLQENCEKMEEEKYKVTQKYEGLLKEKENINQKRDENGNSGGSVQWKQLETSIKKLDSELGKVHNELKLLTFHYDLLNQDFEVELIMRPELLRYIGTLEIKVKELEESLEVKNTEKHETKKRLALIRTNCEKMREIMQKYLGSRASTEMSLRKSHTQPPERATETETRTVRDKSPVSTTTSVRNKTVKSVKNPTPNKQKNVPATSKGQSTTSTVAPKKSSSNKKSITGSSATNDPEKPPVAQKQEKLQNSTRRNEKQSRKQNMKTGSSQT